MKVKAYAIIATKNGEVFGTNGFANKFIKGSIDRQHVTIYTLNSKALNRQRKELKSPLKSVRDKSRSYIEYQQHRMMDGLERGVDIFRKHHPDYDFFISRVNSKKCPIKIHWKEAFDELKYKRFACKRTSRHFKPDMTLSGQKIRFKYSVR